MHWRCHCRYHNMRRAGGVKLGIVGGGATLSTKHLLYFSSVCKSIIAENGIPTRCSFLARSSTVSTELRTLPEKYQGRKPSKWKNGKVVHTWCSQFPPHQGTLCICQNGLFSGKALRYASLICICRVCK